MVSIFFSLLFIWAVVEAARQTEGLSKVRLILMGIIACLGGMAFLFGVTIAVAFLATLAMFAVLADETALKVADNDWYVRGLSLGTTIALYYPFRWVVQAWYRRVERRVATASSLY